MIDCIEFESFSAGEAKIVSVVEIVRSSTGKAVGSVEEWFGHGAGCKFGIEGRLCANVVVLTWICVFKNSAS